MRGQPGDVSMAGSGAARPPSWHFPGGGGAAVDEPFRVTYSGTATAPIRTTNAIVVANRRRARGVGPGGSGGAMATNGAPGSVSRSERPTQVDGAHAGAASGS